MKEEIIPGLVKEQIIQDVNLIHSNTGVLIGTVLLVLLWLVLGLMERRGQHIGGMIATAIRKPLLLGLSSSLYLGWLGRHIANNVEWLDGSNAIKLSATITILAVMWALSRLGHAVMETRRFERWLQMDDPKDRSMAISFIGRIYTILILVIGSGALMLTFGIPATALAALAGGAGVGLAFGTQNISQNFFPVSCCSSTVPLRRGIGSVRMGWKEPLKTSAGITHAYAPLTEGRCISLMQSLRPIASSIQGKCITGGSWQILACDMKTSPRWIRLPNKCANS